MDSMDFNKLSELEDQLGKIIFQMEDIIQNGEFTDPLAEQISNLEDAWWKLGNYLEYIGRDPHDIKKLDRTAY